MTMIVLIRSRVLAISRRQSFSAGDDKTMLFCAMRSGSFKLNYQGNLIFNWEHDLEAAEMWVDFRSELAQLFFFDQSRNISSSSSVRPSSFDFNFGSLSSAGAWSQFLRNLLRSSNWNLIKRQIKLMRLGTHYLVCMRLALSLGASKLLNYRHSFFSWIKKLINWIIFLISIRWESEFVRDWWRNIAIWRGHCFRSELYYSWRDASYD